MMKCFDEKLQWAILYILSKFQGEFLSKAALPKRLLFLGATLERLRNEKTST